jgi:sugar phosphate isomerase/epimerase
MSLKVGIQLYSVRNSLKQDPGGTLEALAEAGYRYLEAANHNAAEDPGVGFGLSAKEMKARLDDLGLSIIGSHIFPWKPESLDPVLDYHQEIGNTRIGCAIEFFPYNDLDHLRRLCDAFNRAGELCKERGMQFYYHNHYHEFQKFGGKTVYELLAEYTEADLVFLELDTYWAARAGVNPIDIIEKYQDRLILLHQKDFPEGASDPLNLFDGIVDPERNIDFEVFAGAGNPKSFTEIGTGVLPIQDYIDAANKAPQVEYIILEQDHTRLDELESVRVSMEAFKRFSGIAL